MRIQTQKLRLEPDKEVPGLKRLRFSPVDVTVEEVFLKGVHPHSVVRAGNQHDYTGMADTILAKLNELAAYLPELKAHSLDRIVRPGAMVSGTVVFSDGVKANWSLDQMGRLALGADRKDYRPSAEDIQAFQQAITAQLRKAGYG